ncbi:MAG: NAD(P)/FAD-dependent oxidoreductase [Chloroflexi bacterium]|nr:NAD(P)/FAD-dependent oxidoreductase [Chloroflexota bacterium]
MIHYLIIGNGAAGLSAAEAIRRRDKRGRITIVSNEPYPLYSRPGIAYVILGRLSEEQLITRPLAFYKEHDLQLRFGTITHLDVQRQEARLDDGELLAYDVCLLATGSSAVRPPLPGIDLDGVISFDTLDDAKEVIAKGRRAKAAVVVGGGITAMELAEGFRHQRTTTHLLQRRDRIWPRLFNEHESAIIEEQIRHEGIKLRYHSEIAEILGDKGKVKGVLLKSGETIKCQVVGIAVGVRPNLQLLKESDIELNRGVIVNDFMQSSHPTLLAAGDVAQVYDRWTGEHHLDVLWPSAINEGRTAGHNMVDITMGREPSHAYRKGSPFNAAMLFGVHLTVIGRVGSTGADEAEQSRHYLSRGSSFVWTLPLSANQHSAWDNHGITSVRIVIAEGRIIGALLLGNQLLADPLRQLIEQEVPLGAYESALLAADADLPEIISNFWHQWRHA